MRRYDIVFPKGQDPYALPNLAGLEVHDSVPYFIAAIEMPADNIALVDSLIGIVNIALSYEEAGDLIMAGYAVEEHRQNTATPLAETPDGTPDPLYTIWQGIEIGNTLAQVVNEGSVTDRRTYYPIKYDGSRYAGYTAAPYLSTIPGQTFSYTEIPAGEVIPVHCTAYDMPRLWALGYVGEGMKIGFIDTGYTGTEHPDVTITEWANVGVTMEGANHATGTIGVTAARKNGSGLVGMQHESEIYSTTYNNIPAALSWLISKGVKIINCSFYLTPGIAEKAAFKACEDRGIAVIVSAGNALTTPEQINYFAANRACTPVSGRRSGDCYKRIDTIQFSSVLPVAGKGVEWVTDAIVLTARLGVSPYGVGRGTSYSAPIFTGLLSIAMQAYPHLPPPIVLELMRLNAREIEGGFLVPDLSFIKHPKPTT